ncbi:hypothetical protein PRUB_a0071 [Pseudoalteromonas rubra]|uniref:Uncharacterized protein n=1 Tax=Pseudoalteromonas rubra TaxID=43658 RepID=A0A8T0C4L9_9GAMM|nr:hypothetical protein PRUB_a0071 [Pseudoalteromonas rubra]
MKCNHSLAQGLASVVTFEKPAFSLHGKQMELCRSGVKRYLTALRFRPDFKTK